MKSPVVSQKQNASAPTAVMPGKMTHNPLQLKAQASQWKQNPLQAPTRGTNRVATNPLQMKTSSTGLPTSLKAGVENLSGYNMQDVKVHYNSPKPALMMAHAYAQGTEIHVAPGQEKYLPHEAWHVVQQKQGRVAPTVQLKNKVAVNNSQHLEKEADAMGAQLLKQTTGSPTPETANPAAAASHPLNNPQLPAQPVVQRILRSGTDPLIGYAAGNDHSLLYGLHPSRQATQGRLTAQDATMGAQPIRTIDDYNQGVGINNLMTANQAAVGLFTVREALMDPNPVANWGTYFPGAVAAVNANPNLQAWIAKLVTNRHSIGLFDIGDRTKVGKLGFRKRAGVKRLQSKSRFDKNFGNPTAGHANNITPKEISSYLRAGRTFNQAFAAFTALSAVQQAALNQWVYKAFFRRTSKLGIDFAINDLNARINFNTGGAVDYTSADAQTARPRERGLLQSNEFVNQNTNRAITISELRHIKKGLRNNTIQPANVNFYDEY